MSIDQDDTVAVLLARLDALEELAGIVPSPDPHGVDSEGWPTHVAPTELIESAWGNAVVDKLQVLRTNRVARGVVQTTSGGTGGYGWVSSTSGTAATTSEVQWGGTIAWQTEVGRLYRITAQGAVATNNAGGDTAALILRNETSVVTQQSQLFIVSTYGTNILIEEVVAGNGGIVSRTLWIQRVTGTGTLTGLANASNRATLLIEDVGAI